MHMRAFAAVILTAAVPAFAVGAGGNGAAASETPLVDRQAQALKYVRCLRDHGIDARMDSDGGIAIRIHGPKPSAPGADKKMLGPPPAMRRAEEACKEYSPKQGGTPEQRRADLQRALAQALTFARCMRNHGINFPDPQASADGGIMQAGPA